MSLLTINGIELPIARNSYKAGEIEIGASGRAQSGAAWKSVRAVKRTVSLTTAPMAKTDADAWSSLLNGRAVNWDFEADSYSLQGHVGIPAGSAARTTGQHKFGVASLSVPASSYIGWPVGAGVAWSIARWCRWLNPSTGLWAWDHQVVTSSGGGYLNGATSVGGPATLTISYGSVVVSYDAVSGTTYSDDLWFLPAVVPVSWPAQMYAHGAQLVASPSFTAAGDLLGESVVMQAKALEREPVEVSGAVLWRLSAEMEES